MELCRDILVAIPVADPSRGCTPPHFRGWHLKETHIRVVNIFTENLKRFLAGEPLKN